MVRYYLVIVRVMRLGNEMIAFNRELRFLSIKDRNIVLNELNRFCESNNETLLSVYYEGWIGTDNIDGLAVIQ